MKKILYSALALLALTGCAGNNSEKKQEEADRIADSIAQVEAREKAIQDSIEASVEQARQDSIQRMEKAMSAVPSFAMLMAGDSEALFTRLGYKIERRRIYDDMIGEYETYITATCEPVEGVYLQYREDFWQPFEFIIKGLPEARDRFHAEANAWIANERRKHPDDWSMNSWYAKKNGDKIIVYMLAD